MRDIWNIEMREKNERGKSNWGRERKKWMGEKRRKNEGENGEKGWVNWKIENQNLEWKWMRICECVMLKKMWNEGGKEKERWLYVLIVY